VLSGVGGLMYRPNAAGKTNHMGAMGSFKNDYIAQKHQSIGAAVSTGLGGDAESAGCLPHF